MLLDVRKQMRPFHFGSASAWYVESSEGFTRRVLYMIVRARTARPNHRLPGSRRCAGTFFISVSDWIGMRSPSRAAFHKFPASTVTMTSARVLAPSARSRSKTSLLFPMKKLTLIPVFSVNSSKAASDP